MKLNNMSVLIVDDDLAFLKNMEGILGAQGLKVSTATNGIKACQMLLKEHFDVCLADLVMPDVDGVSLLKRIKASGVETEIVLITGHGSIETAVEAVKRGAYHYLTKPVKPQELLSVLEEIYKSRKLSGLAGPFEEKIDREFDGYRLIGNHPKMKMLFEDIAKLSKSDCTVLIEGESGTGKELVARAIHHNGTRQQFPFVAVSCGAIPEGMLESEIFGHERGAFTGAYSLRKGKFELADRGTLFLDEIGEASQAVQVRLLRVMERKEFERVGGEKLLRVDIKIIAATNKNLQKEVETKRFREDLFHRLNVVLLTLPSLRERVEDIPALANNFLALYAKKLGKETPILTIEAIRTLKEYSWPGNIRELEHMMERIVTLTEVQQLSPRDIFQPQPEDTSNLALEPEQVKSLRDVEKAQILTALRVFRWNITKTAKALDISRLTLREKIKRYDLYPTMNLLSPSEA